MIVKTPMGTIEVIEYTTGYPGIGIKLDGKELAMIVCDDDDIYKQLTAYVWDYSDINGEYIYKQVIKGGK